MTREQWAALYDSPKVQETVQYISWLADHMQTSEVAAAVKVLFNGKSRTEQLRRYADKKHDPNATFRPYAPIKASDKARVELKRRAQAEGVAEVRTPLCGHENLRGERCWLPPHGESVPHKF